MRVGLDKNNQIPYNLALTNNLNLFHKTQSKCVTCLGIHNFFNVFWVEWKGMNYIT